MNDFPTLTTAERDRRYAALRTLMDGAGLDAVLVAGLGRDQLDRYLTNEGTRSYCVLPRHGDPVSVVPTGNVTLGRYDEPGRRYERWVADQRLTRPGHQLGEVLDELGLGQGHIGVVGLRSRAPASTAGVIPFGTWQRVLDRLPSATFVDFHAEFEQLMLVHSDEELEMIRFSAGIGESACAAMIDAAAAGVRESEIIGAGMHATAAGGGLWLNGPQRSGAERLGWAGADWLWMGGGGRALEQGDVFGAELFTFYGGFESQQQIEISIGRPDEVHRRLEEIAVDAYSRGVEYLRTGGTFAELCAVMEAPLRAAGAWNMGPVVQTVSPVIFNGATHVGLDEQAGLAGVPLPHTSPRDGDFEIVPGIAFAFEPNACLDRSRVSIGGTVLVTAEGVEELNKLCLRVNVV
ncbi:M24 family metallopeptidase [Nocardioides sp. AN3]